MKGQTVSHYRILDELGRGGMGIVYRAQDEKLQRTVALKFLSPNLVLDNFAKQRFVREAQVVSALDHSNICTIFEIDELPDGRLFMVMACYEGESLRQRIERSPIPVAEAVELLIQLADGLSKAHHAGIVHRDIKPSNLFITRDGVLKILDFGLAKQSDQTALTQTSHVMGTIAYISPEQLQGSEAGPQSDIWAAGVVFYEMLSGKLPFRGGNAAAALNATLTESPKPLHDFVPGIPQILQRIINRALAKNPSERFTSAAELREALNAARTELSPMRSAERGPSRGFRRARTIIAGSLFAVIALVATAWAWRSAGHARWAREIAIPEITQLVERGKIPEAFTLGQQALHYVPNDPMLRTLRRQFAATFSVKSTPVGADVYVIPYEKWDAEWEYLGRTPLEGISMPRRPYRWKISKNGFETMERATASLADRMGAGDWEVTLLENGKQPQGMVFVPGGQSSARLNGASLDPLQVPPFFIDRYEVTNKEFKEFVEAGGYAHSEFWDGLDFVNGGVHLSLAVAMKEFVDSTQRAGPAGWELGSYLKDQADFPVTGVSWYEAMAYASYRGKTLPTVYHWGRASTPDYELMSALASASVPLSNFGGVGLTPAGQHHGMGPYGTFDMLGNAREWVQNAAPDGGMLLGGGWLDPPYFYGTAFPSSLFDRSKTNGFRLMKELKDSGDAALRQTIRFNRKNISEIKPPSDEVFEAYRSQFAYVHGTPQTVKPVVVETTEDWIKQKVTIETGYRNERMDVFLFIPARSRPPFQAAVFFPPTDAFLTRSSSDGLPPGVGSMPLDHIVRSGRVLVEPIFQGSFERWNRLNISVEGGYIQKVVDWRWDLGRTLDYLESRKDIDSSKVAFVGLSFGASYPLPLMTVEPRFKTALLLSGGEPNREMPPSVDPMHYFSRIKIPVLMLNGGFDPLFPITNQEMVFNSLGTRAEDKRHVVFPESSHAYFPRREYLRETLDWLDKYLGRVN